MYLDFDILFISTFKLILLQYGKTTGRTKSQSFIHYKAETILKCT